jgi:O-antigen/teichoic acid export membrane protein
MPNGWPRLPAHFSGWLKRDLTLLRSSGLVLVGNSIARFLGFVFVVVAARILDPPDFGVLSYALAILVPASILLTNAPNGLSRFLARYTDVTSLQAVYLSNWTAVAGLLLAATLLVVMGCAPLIGLSGWMLIGLAVNLIGVAAFELYVQALRGSGRFGVMGTYYTLANMLQLVGIALAAVAGSRSAALFFVIYGVSPVVALVAMQLAWPLPVSLNGKTMAWSHVWRILRYVLPVVAQGIFFAVWSAGDLVLIEHLLNPTATGNYAAAKTLAQLLTLGPTALYTAAGPTLSRLPEKQLRKYLLRLEGLAGLVVVPLGIGLLVLRQPLIMLLYGTKYPHIIDGLTPLVAAMVAYGLYTILSTTWSSLGRPIVGACATAIGAITSIALIRGLIPSLGLLGAAIGFAAGSGAQLIAIATFTAWALYSGPAVRLGHLPDSRMLRFSLAGSPEVRSIKDGAPHGIVRRRPRPIAGERFPLQIPART